MYRVVFDVDGVVADFERAFCEKFGWEHRDEFCLEERYPDRWDEIQSFVQDPKVYKYLDIVPLGVAIAKFCDQEKMEIRFISSRPEELVDDTSRWLKQNKIPFFSVSTGEEWKSPKFSRITRVGCVRFVVEDNLSIAKKVADYGIPVFLIDQPWNQSDEILSGIIYRIGNFQEFLGKYTQFFDDF